ncbi:DUF3027 domain-containing protein [Rathayibacter rathayi]|uniref:DUF3027 domain-containing protein n=1 Tax=Rathayibacter rathayi TaxID=33887 RepID=UPI000CE9157F|nr:DUF3027 domain-containing protein [Rathayibacter rathayi]PPG90728.1 DUF3027 domain-containing protein [Rathayibacter rathayi]PPG98775.1 DUF3027 domain-containing protein [Rathayibacter rathayi]
MPDADDTTAERGPIEATEVDAPVEEQASAGDPVALEEEDLVEDVPELVFEADPVLAAALDVARTSLAEIAPAGTIGELVTTLVQGEHIVSLQFANLMRGYPGWLWTATLSRIDETEDVTVLEVELLPGEGAVLAPDWVPWTVRLADYHAAQDTLGEEVEDADDDLDDEPDLDDDSDDDDADDYSDEAPDEDDSDDSDDPAVDELDDDGSDDDPEEDDSVDDGAEQDDTSGDEPEAAPAPSARRRRRRR